MDDYPKWLPDPGMTVASAAEEAAVIDGSAIIETIHSAEGDTLKFAGFGPKPDPKKKKR